MVVVQGLQVSLEMEIRKLKIRARAFTGAFVGMVSPLLLAIVLKKTNLKGVGKYQGTRMLEGFFDLFQGIFPFLTAVTFQMSMMPFLFIMVSEACAHSLPCRLIYVAKRLLTASKMVIFFSNILLMFLGCGVLVFIHKKAWYSLLVVSACFLVAVIVIILHICSCWWWYRQADNNVGGTEDYHSKLEHSLELAAGITAMMFLVLGSVVLEGLFRSTQLLAEPLAPAPAPAPSEGPTTKGPGTFLAATLFLSFVTSAFAAFLMNVWTIPLVIQENGRTPPVQELPITPVPAGSGSSGPSDDAGDLDKFALGLNITLVILAVVVVILITWEGLQIVACLILLPPAILLFVLLIRCSCGDGLDGVKEETKPAPLELTKVAFTGFLALAVPGITSAPPGGASKFFVFCAASTVVLGLLWRLLTHDKAPSPAVRKAVNHSSLLAQAFLFCAGISFGKMASC
ncbi:unnamed protein product [Urochloa decumbens]|uniref:Uncharacterized protein n=1 Tax=Urochloa decumbens TaxID=240449 RepID=A0ABC8YTT1_9POAL